MRFIDKFVNKNKIFIIKEKSFYLELLGKIVIYFMDVIFVYAFNY